MEKEFEEIWNKKKAGILLQDKEYKETLDSYKMNGSTGILMFVIPVAAGLLFMNKVNIGHEIMKWVAGAAVTIVTFVVCVWVKSILTGGKSLSEIEQRIKTEQYEKYKREGDI